MIILHNDLTRTFDENLSDIIDVGARPLIEHDFDMPKIESHDFINTKSFNAKINLRRRHLRDRIPRHHRRRLKY